MADARPALPPFDSSMRHLLVSPDLRAGAAEMLPANIGLIPFGLVCGVGSVAAGADWLGAWGMAAIMFSGAAQILAAQLLAVDAPLAIIVLTSFVLGQRSPQRCDVFSRRRRLALAVLAGVVHGRILRRLSRAGLVVAGVRGAAVLHCAHRAADAQRSLGARGDRRRRGGDAAFGFAHEA